MDSLALVKAALATLKVGHGWDWFPANEVPAQSQLPFGTVTPFSGELRADTQSSDRVSNSVYIDLYGGSWKQVETAADEVTTLLDRQVAGAPIENGEVLYSLRRRRGVWRVRFPRSEALIAGDRYVRIQLRFEQIETTN